MIRTPLAVAGTVAVVATALAGIAAAPADATAAPAGTAGPCRMRDVSFYFGGYTEGLGQRSFDITLLAHDGTDCTLPDRPEIVLGTPRGQKRRVVLHVNGRGGTLEITPATPLHASVFYTAPDTRKDTVRVTSMSLAMPGGGRTSTYFGLPGTTELAAVNGVLVTAWTTGIGLGQGEQSF